VQAAHAADRGQLLVGCGQRLRVEGDRALLVAAPDRVDQQLVMPSSIGLRATAREA
jgi:hypothetical protein